MDLARMAEDVTGDPLPPTAFDGKSLGDAFYELVVRDGRFWDAVHALTRTSWRGIECRPFGTGIVFPSRSGLWPLQVRTLDLLNGWFSPDHWQHGERVVSLTDPVPVGYPWYSPDDDLELFLAAELVISGVLDRFLAPLRSGAVVATGHADRGQYQPVPLLTAVWERPDTRINIRASSIHQVTGWTIDSVELEGEVQYFRHERFKDEFSAVSLSLKETNSYKKNEITDINPTRYRDRGVIPWDKAIDQIMFKLIVEKNMTKEAYLFRTCSI